MVLKELVRHENVSTTETFCLGIDADSTAAMFANRVRRGDILGDTAVETVESSSA